MSSLQKIPQSVRFAEKKEDFADFILPLFKQRNRAEKTYMDMVNFQKAYIIRFKNQIAHGIAAGASLALTTTGLILGTLIGVQLASRFFSTSPAFQITTVILSTVFGFLSGLSFAYALGPQWIRIGFQAHALKKNVTLPNHMGQAHIYEIDDEVFTSFGKNVVITGFRGATGWFTPTLFIAHSVAQKCTESEMDAIFGHELAHLYHGHLKERISKALFTFLGGAISTLCILVGLRLSGYTEVAAGSATIAGFIPVILMVIHNRRITIRQEFEADQTALSQFGAFAQDLISALEKLSTLNGNIRTTLLTERINTLQKAKTLPHDDRIAA